MSVTFKVVVSIWLLLPVGDIPQEGPGPCRSCGAARFAEEQKEGQNPTIPERSHSPRTRPPATAHMGIHAAARFSSSLSSAARLFHGVSCIYKTRVLPGFEL